LPLEVKTFFDSNRELAVAKVEEKVSPMVEQGSFHYYCLLQPSRAFNVNSSCENLSSVTERPVLLNIQKVFKVDLRLVSYPLLNQRVVLQQFLGCSIVIVGDPSQVLAKDDLHTWLQKGHHSLLERNRIVVLKPGDALVLPLATSPFVLGVPYTVEGNPIWPKFTKDDVDIPVGQHVAYSVTPFMDSVLDLKHSYKATANAYSTFLRAHEYLPATVRSMRSVEVWQEALKARPQESS